MRTETGSPGDVARRSFVGLASAAFLVLVALRLLTLARDTWEWDELLFVGAARDGLDVRVNHPHPPGYPLFVLPARLLVLLGASPFGATLGVAVVAGLGAALLLAGLARELGAGREEALWAGLLWAALAVGASVGVRPQVAVALLPLAAVAAFRAARTPLGRRRAATAATAGLPAGLLPYVPVVAGSGGPREYLSAAKEVAEYVRAFDTPPLRDLATAALWEKWLVDPFGGPFPGSAAWFAAAGIAVAPRAFRLVALAFVPLLLFSAASLNTATAPRYGIAFLAAAPLAASVGLTRLGARWRPVAAVLGTALLAVVSLPAAEPLCEVALRPSPPVAAMAALRHDPDLADRPVLLDPAFRVHWLELGRGMPFAGLEQGRPVVAPSGTVVVTHDGDLPGYRPVRVFRFESEALRRISRGRYLSVTIGESRAASPRVGPLKATDLLLLSSVDEPAEGAVVPVPLFVRGWCQERGGELVVPAEFRVDGVPVVPERLVRSPRPDVSAALPDVGDTPRAGFEAFLPAGAVPPGEQVLEVVFETRDRRRVYPPRRFTVSGTASPTRGSS